VHALSALSVYVVVPMQVEAVNATQWKELEEAGDLGVVLKNPPKVVFDKCVDGSQRIYKVAHSPSPVISSAYIHVWTCTDTGPRRAERSRGRQRARLLLLAPVEPARAQVAPLRLRMPLSAAAHLRAGTRERRTLTETDLRQ
jgi:hypothetical protein